ncbi:hypothetical protein PHYSODRAFT_253042 [Phytophthora sojae]|uniref:Partial AB-hydrolase lipase domain-containing protein n=1 Tax=Phytophthora sojae (strain P6497) TaxID=1094619 RepID=G4ZJ18_PHYSP|nr:hypothetical protein PHYSODRAFT_253042 [Phytophthora sojae]EGZ17265.1 hypothetical protein PHYSODRAFT_253042 [Phytophthora sojae]|eukprot:XP_009526323.1 hypothetical protein PHYSODRAFT_253042 [Phytophthora sojae]
MSIQAANEVPGFSLGYRAPADPDTDKTVVEIVQARSYAIETHKVTTSDRYVLTMYRLPKTYAESQSGSAAAPNKPAVHLQHGLLDSSFTFISNFRNKSLAYVLADAGFDVWLVLGFHLEDMGLYDLPAFVNHILATTGRSTVSYVGHSEGTTQAFVGFSENQEIAQKVDYLAALAPVAWTGHTTAEYFVALAKENMDEMFLNLGFTSFLPHCSGATVFTT